MLVELLTLQAAVLAAPLAPGKAMTGFVAGTYSNEEEVYFDEEAKRPAAPRVSMSIADGTSGPSVQVIDQFGNLLKQSIDAKTLTQTSPNRIKLTLPDGKVTELRLARPVLCWVAVRKDKPKADGSEDWYFKSDIKLFDQGGRAKVGGGDSGAQEVVIRMRNVTWDNGTSKPVQVLYLHKPQDPVKAVSYAWASPDSKLVGINLRWVQTGCAVNTDDLGRN